MHAPPFACVPAVRLAPGKEDLDRNDCKSASPTFSTIAWLLLWFRGLLSPVSALAVPSFGLGSFPRTVLHLGQYTYPEWYHTEESVLIPHQLCDVGQTIWFGYEGGISQFQQSLNGVTAHLRRGSIVRVEHLNTQRRRSSRVCGDWELPIQQARRSPNSSGLVSIDQTSKPLCSR